MIRVTLSCLLESQKQANVANILRYHYQSNQNQLNSEFCTELKFRPIWPFPDSIRPVHFTVFFIYVLIRILWSRYTFLYTVVLSTEKKCSSRYASFGYTLEETCTFWDCYAIVWKNLGLDSIEKKSISQYSKSYRVYSVVTRGALEIPDALTLSCIYCCHLYRTTPVVQRECWRWIKGHFLF